jgi:hypothetical protein
VNIKFLAEIIQNQMRNLKNFNPKKSYDRARFENTQLYILEALRKYTNSKQMIFQQRFLFPWLVVLQEILKVVIIQGKPQINHVENMCL